MPKKSRATKKHAIPFRFRIKKTLNDEKSNEELSRLKIIRMLNDDFRYFALKDFRQIASSQHVFLSPRILEFDMVDQWAVIDLVKNYRVFDEESNFLHEKGQFTYAENSIVWEIHCFDNTLENPSPDPSDIHCTHRHITIAFNGEISS